MLEYDSGLCTVILQTIEYVMNRRYIYVDDSLN